MKRFLAAAVAAVSLVLAACTSSDPLGGDTGGGGSPGEIVVGSADFTENELLMEIYAAALRSTGAQVRTRPRIGSREITVPALRDGSLTVVPEYTGNLLQYVDKGNTATGSDEVYAALREKLPEGLEVLAKSPAEDRDVLVVTQETAERLGLRSMTDLGPRCGELVLGAAGEWRARWEKRIQELYGCTFREIRTTDAGGPVTVRALQNGEVQVANLFTTASVIRENNFVELADPEQMYPAQNVVPLVRSGALGQEQREALDRVSAALDTARLTELVRRVEVDREPAPDVAAEFVGSLGL